MEELVRQHVAPVAVGLAVGYLMRYVEPRSRVVHWFPAAFRFDVVPPEGGPTVTMWTHALTLQNVGWRAAANVEIVHNYKPHHFKIQPGVAFTELTNPQNQHVIKIDSLARREWVTIQILTAGAQLPNLVGVRSADGPSRFVNTRQHFVIPRPRQILVAALSVIGFVTAAYWGGRFVTRFAQLLMG